MPFPTIEQFDQAINSHDTIQKWRDIPTNVIYQIIRVNELDTRYGKALILTLKDQNDTIQKYWATQTIRKELTDFNRKITSSSCYIKSNGLKRSNKNPNQQYYNFSIIWDEDDDEGMDTVM